MEASGTELEIVDATSASNKEFNPITALWQIQREKKRCTVYTVEVMPVSGLPCFPLLCAGGDAAKGTLPDAMGLAIT